MESKGIQILHVFKGLFLCFMPKPEKKIWALFHPDDEILKKQYASRTWVRQGLCSLTNLKAYQVNWKQN